MSGTVYLGYGLIVLSAALLAAHLQQWRTAKLAADVARREFLRRQLQRRLVASGLIGVEGAAMTLVDRVPRTPFAMSGYLFGLMLGAVVILLIAIADMRSARRRQETEQLDALAKALRDVGVSGHKK